MSDPEHEISLDIEEFAEANGMQPSDRPLGDATPFLRLGMMDYAGRTYEGTLDGRDALLAEFAIDSPGASEAFGGSGVSDNWFTLFLVKVDVPDWPRLTVHPSGFSEGWFTRLFHRDDHRVRGFSEPFEDRYRVRAANDVTDGQVHELLDPQLVSWYVDQGELVFDVESNVETGDSLVVARRGLGLSRDQLEQLLAQTRHLIERITQPSAAG